MKYTLFALAFLFCGATSASAFFDAQNQKAAADITSITNRLNIIKSGKAVEAADFKTLLPASQPVPADGEATLTGTFHTAGIGSVTKIMEVMVTNVNLTTFNIHLKIEKGIVVGLVATETVQSGVGVTESDALANAQKAPPTATAWTFGPADFVAKYQSEIPTNVQKSAPVSVPSERKPAAVVALPSPQQETSVVSPSAP